MATIKENLIDLLEVSIFGPPGEPGVYAVITAEYDKRPFTKKEEIVYIGSSKNIKKRLLQPSHHYIRLYNELFETHSVYTKSYITEDFLKLEPIFIKEINPSLNTHHKRKSKK